MKNKILSALISFLICLPCVFSPFRQIHASGNSFTYSIIRQEAVITGFTDEPVTITLPEFIEGCPVREISDNAFYNCKSLKDISFPDNLRRIGHHSFYACTNLEMIDLPDELESLMEYSFCGCTSLRSIRIPPKITSLPDSCFRACTEMKTARIPDSVEYIGDCCFSGCTSLSYVSIGKGTKKIGDSAFFMCLSMWSMYVPPTICELGEYSIGYTPCGNTIVPRNDFNILSKKSSEAEKYAHENNLIFRACSEPVSEQDLKKAERKTQKRHSFPVILSGIFTVITFAFLFRLRHIFRRSQI